MLARTGAVVSHVQGACHARMPSVDQTAVEELVLGETGDGPQNTKNGGLVVCDLEEVEEGARLPPRVLYARRVAELLKRTR